MIRSVQFLSLSLAMLCFAMLLPPSAACGQEQGRYIKLIGVDAENINLEVDGKKLSIPVPDGYEVMRESDNPGMYAKYFGIAEKYDDLSLYAFIHTQDKLARGKDPAMDKCKTAFFNIDRDYKNRRFTEQEFKNETAKIKENNTNVRKNVNKKSKTKGSAGIFSPLYF